jgi:serine/threonine protein phosphatase PrpC
MGCDGIWERYERNGQDLVTLIRQQRIKGKGPEQVLQEMLDGMLGKDPNKEQFGCDNMSVLLIELNKNAF